MAAFFEKRDRWGHGLGLWVLVLMVFAAPPAWFLAGRLRLENDFEHWLPAKDPQARIVAWFDGHFASEDRFLVTWDGSSLQDPRLPALVRRLEGVPDAEGIRRHGIPEVAAVLSPLDLLRKMTAARMGGESVDVETALSRLQGVFLGQGGLKVVLSESGRRHEAESLAAIRALAVRETGRDVTIRESAGPRDLEALAEAAAKGLAGRVGPEEILDDAPTEEELAALARFEPLPCDLEIAWPGMHGDRALLDRLREALRTLPGPGTTGLAEGRPLVAETFVAPGSPVAVAVILTESGSAKPARAVEQVREAARAVGIPEADLHLGGQSVIGSALDEAVRQVGWNPDEPWSRFHRRSPFLTSLLVGIVLSLLVVRRVRLAVLVPCAALYTILLSMALVSACGAEINSVLVVMPTLLLVVTISGAVHVANYWRHAAATDPRRAVVETVRTAFVPCLFASATTAVGLASLGTSPLAPVREFGLYAAAGCLVSLLVMLYGLPACLQCWPGPVGCGPTQGIAPGWRTVGRFLCRFRWGVIGLFVVATAAAVYGLKDFRTETRIIRFFPDRHRVVRDYRAIEEQLAGIVPVETVVRFDAHAQRDSDFLTRLAVVREIEDRLRAHPAVSGSLSLADFLPETESAAGDRPSMLRHRKGNAVRDEVLAPENQAARAFLVVAGTPADLQQPGDMRLNAAGDELWRITSHVSMLGDVDYAAITRDIDDTCADVLRARPGAGHVVTGAVPLFLRTQQAILESLVKSFGITSVVIAITMMCVLRNPLAGLLALLPNIAPVAAIFGLVAWSGTAVDIGMMLTASVGLGIAVDGALHLATWFRLALEKGHSRQEAVAEALANGGPALWQTSAVIGLGLLTLAPAELLLVSRFGWLMAALSGAALLGDAVLLPALMAGPLGAILERQVRRGRGPGDGEPLPLDGETHFVADLLPAAASAAPPPFPGRLEPAEPAVPHPHLRGTPRAAAPRGTRAAG